MKKAFAALATSCFLGCAQMPPPLSSGPPFFGERPSTADVPEAENAYRAIQKKFTDEAEIYARLDTRMFVAATLQSWKFREARVHYVARFEKLPQVKVEERLAAEKAEHDGSIDFFVGAHLNDYRFDDFDRKPSTWRVVLISNGQELEPTKVERIGRANLSLRTLYPYMGEFWNAYRFKFPRKLADGTEALPENVEKVTLRFASTLGAADLEVPTR